MASRGSSFDTAVSIGPEQFNSQTKLNAQGRPINASLAAVRKFFAICGKDHAIELCDLFKRKANKEKVVFLRTNGMCFGCLGKGHMNSNCQRRLICQFCNANHHTELHIDIKFTARNVQNVQKLANVKLSSIKNKSTLLNGYSIPAPNCCLTINYSKITVAMIKTLRLIYIIYGS